MALNLKDYIRESIAPYLGVLKGFLADKQDTLVSGITIKTVNNTSLLGSGDLVVGMTTEDIKAPKSLLIYYGYPIAYNGLWDVSKVVDAISKYDIFVVGDSYQDPTHEEYTTTTAILSQLKAKGVELYGYIPLGVNTSNRSISVLETAIDDWSVLNVDGIFLDEFGFDYEVDRARQIDVVNYLKSKALKYIANAWVWEDFNVDHIDNLPAEWADDDWRRTNFEDHNPSNLVLPRDSSDGYLIENFCVSHMGLVNKFDLIERVTNIVNSNTNNYKLHSIGVFPENNPANGEIDFTTIADLKTLDKLSEYIWMNAYIYGLTSTGGNGYTFGASGGSIATTVFELPFRLFNEDLKPTIDTNLTTGIATRLFNNGKAKLTIIADDTTPAYSASIEYINVFQEDTTNTTNTTIDTTNFDSVLSATDDTAQKAFDTLDDAVGDIDTALNSILGREI